MSTGVTSGTALYSITEAEWLNGVKADLQDYEVQSNVAITLIDVKDQLKKVATWKVPGPDGIQGYWLKYFSSLHGCMAEQLNNMLQSSLTPE